MKCNGVVLSVLESEVIIFVVSRVVVFFIFEKFCVILLMDFVFDMLFVLFFMFCVYLDKFMCVCMVIVV